MVTGFLIKFENMCPSNILPPHEEARRQRMGMPPRCLDFRLETFRLKSARIVGWALSQAEGDCQDTATAQIPNVDARPDDVFPPGANHLGQPQHMMQSQPVAAVMEVERALQDLLLEQVGSSYGAWNGTQSPLVERNLKADEESQGVPPTDAWSLKFAKDRQVDDQAAFAQYLFDRVVTQQARSGASSRLAKRAPYCSIIPTMTRTRTVGNSKKVTTFPRIISRGSITARDRLRRTTCNMTRARIHPKMLIQSPKFVSILLKSDPKRVTPSTVIVVYHWTIASKPQLCSEATLTLPQPQQRSSITSTPATKTKLQMPQCDGAAYQQRI